MVRVVRLAAAAAVPALLLISTAAHASTAPVTIPVATPVPPTPAPGGCPLCDLPIPETRTGPIVAAGTAIALDALGLLAAGGAAVIRSRRR